MQTSCSHGGNGLGAFHSAKYAVAFRIKNNEMPGVLSNRKQPSAHPPDHSYCFFLCGFICPKEELMESVAVSLCFASQSPQKEGFAVRQQTVS